MAFLVFSPDVLLPYRGNKLHGVRAHILNVNLFKDPLIPVVEVFCY